MEFEWDPERAEANFQKHGVDFDDAIGIFDWDTLEDEDTRQDYREIRVRAIGACADGILSVIYTMRGDVCRIISARRANPREQEAYRKAKSGW